MKRFLGLLLIATLCISCSDDLDDNIQASSPGTVSDFIYRGLNFWSLYKADVPDLDNDRFSSQAERNEFLNQFESPEAAFQALLSPQDRFSILRSDFIELENALAGIRLSSGMRFSILADPNNSENLFGVVRFVINNSPAQVAGASYNKKDPSNLPEVFVPICITSIYGSRALKISSLAEAVLPEVRTNTLVSPRLLMALPLLIVELNKRSTSKSAFLSSLYL